MHAFLSYPAKIPTTNANPIDTGAIIVRAFVSTAFISTVSTRTLVSRNSQIKPCHVATPGANKPAPPFIDSYIVVAAPGGVNPRTA